MVDSPLVFVQYFSDKFSGLEQLTPESNTYKS